MQKKISVWCKFLRFLNVSLFLPRVKAVSFLAKCKLTLLITQNQWLADYNECPCSHGCTGSSADPWSDAQSAESSVAEHSVCLVLTGNAPDSELGRGNCCKGLFCLFYFPTSGKKLKLLLLVVTVFTLNFKYKQKSTNGAWSDEAKLTSRYFYFHVSWNIAMILCSCLILLPSANTCVTYQVDVHAPMLSASRANTRDACSGLPDWSPVPGILLVTCPPV